MTFSTLADQRGSCGTCRRNFSSSFISSEDQPCTVRPVFGQRYRNVVAKARQPHHLNVARSLTLEPSNSTEPD